ncbi:MAG: TonB family protein [Candidatus Omnitrophota bacterium]
MRKLFLNLVIVATFITVLPFKGFSAGGAEEEIKLYIGHPQIISVSSPKRVAVGNPEIADVGNISKTELTVNPKIAGSTNLIVWDNFGEQSYRLKVFAEDIHEIKRRIDSILSTLDLTGVYTKAEEDEARVALLGTVKFAKDKEKITTALAGLKSKTVDLTTVKEEESVIEIDVQVIELNSGSREKVGFTWPESINLTELASQATAAPGTTSFAKLFTLGNLTRNVFNLNLDMLVKEGKARILSRPRLSCQSGKEAKLVVGGEVPILSGSVTPGTSGPTPGATTGGSVEYKEYGIILNVKPQLTDTGRIHLNLDVSVTDLGEEVKTDYALAYKMIKRSATTELFLDNQQTMAIGGLIKKKSADQLRKVPWLSDIPVLGVFFRQKISDQGSTSDQSFTEDTELFITLTPTVISRVKPQEKSLKILSSNIPSVGDDKITDPVLKYSKIIQKRILEKLVYPAEAKDAGFQGAVRLSLKLSAQGDLLDVKLKDSSSFRVLDEGTLKTAKEISPYPPFPPEIKDKEVWVEIPIIYQLE